MAVEWYYAIDNKSYGPVTAAQLKEMAERGQLKPTDLVWRTGLATWVPAQKVKGLFTPGTAVGGEIARETVPPAEGAVEPQAHSVSEVSAITEAQPFPGTPSAAGSGSHVTGVEGDALAAEDKTEAARETPLRPPPRRAVHPLEAPKPAEVEGAAPPGAGVPSLAPIAEAVGGMYKALQGMWAQYFVERACQGCRTLLPWVLVAAATLLVLAGAFSIGFSKEAGLGSGVLLILSAAVLLVLYWVGRPVTAFVETWAGTAGGRLSGSGVVVAAAALVWVLGLAAILFSTLRMSFGEPWYVLLQGVAYFALAQYAAIVMANPRAMGLAIEPAGTLTEEVLGYLAWLLQVISRLIVVVATIFVVWGTLLVAAGLLVFALPDEAGGFLAPLPGELQGLSASGMPIYDPAKLRELMLQAGIAGQLFQEGSALDWLEPGNVAEAEPPSGSRLRLLHRAAYLLEQGAYRLFLGVLLPVLAFFLVLPLRLNWELLHLLTAMLGQLAGGSAEEEPS